MKQGQVCKIHSDFYYVDDGSDVHECKIKEILKKRKEKVFTGDFVQFDNGVIDGILPRRNFIPRPSAANIDQIVIVSALKEPDLNLNQLNRYIALAKYYKIPAVLCFNKVDRLTDLNKPFNHSTIQPFNPSTSKPLDLPSVYEPLGFKVVFTSATEHIGIKAFEEILGDKMSVLCGNSGVGKSSLINAINPDLALKIGAVSEKTQRGTHTTRHCEIIKIEAKPSASTSSASNLSARIVDTPGFSNVRFDFILPKDVDGLFGEFAQYDCKYSDCLHINEDGCGVLANLDKIAPSRYESYLEFIAEAREYKEKIKYEGTKKESAKKISGSRELAKISEKKRQSGRNTAKQKLYHEHDQESEQ